MDFSRLTRWGQWLAWLTAAVMAAAAWICGQRLHDMHYGGGCVLLATCVAGLVAFTAGWLVLRCLGVRIVKCRRRNGGTLC